MVWFLYIILLKGCLFHPGLQGLYELISTTVKVLFLYDVIVGSGGGDGVDV